jgi:hypothetical protein
MHRPYGTGGACSAPTPYTPYRKYIIFFTTDASPARNR